MSGSDRVYEKIIENERGTILASKKEKKKKNPLEKRPLGLARKRFCSVFIFSTFSPMAQTRQTWQSSGPWNLRVISLVTYSLKFCYNELTLHPCCLCPVNSHFIMKEDEP